MLLSSVQKVLFDENQNTKRFIWKLLIVMWWNYNDFLLLQVTFLKQQTDKETVFLQAGSEINEMNNLITHMKLKLLWRWNYNDFFLFFFFLFFFANHLSQNNKQTRKQFFYKQAAKEMKWIISSLTWSSSYSEDETIIYFILFFNNFFCKSPFSKQQTDKETVFLQAGSERNEMNNLITHMKLKLLWRWNYNLFYFIF